MTTELVEPASTQTLTRRSMPRVRRGVRVDVEIAGTAFAVTANLDADQRLGEVFVDFGKHGSFGSGLTEAFAELLSLALAHGMPLDEFVAKFRDMRFEPAGMTDDPEIRWVTSPMDYLARRLGKDFLPVNRQVTLGITEADTAALAS